MNTQTSNDHLLQHTGSTPTPIRFVDLQAQYRHLEEEIDAAVQEVLSRCDFVLGSAVEKFEESFAAYCEADHCIGVGSGLDALTLALSGLGIGTGDEVIIPANTFIATAFSVLATGATPVLVEYDPTSYTIDPECVRRAITAKTAAIVPVHLYGCPADMDAIGAIAQEHNLLVVEDAAQAHGATYRGRRCGSLGHAAAFSFYPAKNLGACGDGGAVVTNDSDLADTIRKTRNYGSTIKHHHEVVGVNSRLDSVQAAVLNVKLPHLDEWNALRRSAAAAYHQAMWDLPIELPTMPCDRDHAFHLYVVQVDDRDLLQTQLQHCGIQTGIHYPVPIHEQPACADRCKIPQALLQTERAADRLLSLPMHPELSQGDVDRVAEAVRSLVSELEPCEAVVGQQEASLARQPV